MALVSQTDLAWLAGYMDGEGTIGMHRANQKNWPHPYLCPTFQVPNTDRRLVDRSADIIEAATGARPAISVASKGGNGCKKSWRVRVRAQRHLCVLLPLLLPYLVSKRRQAELLLEFCQRRVLRGRYSWYEFKELDEAAYLECLALNRRGVEQRSGATVKPALQVVKEA